MWDPKAYVFREIFCSFFFGSISLVSNSPGKMALKIIQDVIENLSKYLAVGKIRLHLAE